MPTGKELLDLIFEMYDCAEYPGDEKAIELVNTAWQDEVVTRSERHRAMTYLVAWRNINRAAVLIFSCA